MEFSGQFSALIDCIYLGATDVKAWPEIVQALSTWMGAPKGLLFTPLQAPRHGGFAFPHALPPSFLNLWDAQHQATDLWTQRALERGLGTEGQIVLDQDLLSEAELTSSAWYQDFLVHQDIGRVASGVVFSPSSTGMPATAISLFRSLRDAPYTEADRDRLRLVFPHVSRALGILLTLRDAEFRVAGSMSALDRLDAGVLLLDAHGAVSFANQAAQAMLGERDGVSLRSATPHRGMRLSAQDDDIGQAIEAAIEMALGRHVDISHFHQTIAVRRPSGAPAYSLQISALGGQAAFDPGKQPPRAIAFLVNPQRRVRLDARQLMALHGLTPAEASVAVQLVAGEPMGALAQTLGISINTLKTQVQKIYEKMGVDSRAAFVRDVLTQASIHLQ